MRSFTQPFRDELAALFRWRRDVRRFRRDALPAGRIEALIEEAARSAPSVGLSQPARFVLVEDAARRDAIRRSFERCNAEALAATDPGRHALYARLKLAGLGEAPAQLAVFAETNPAQGHGLGRQTMPETLAYSAVLAIHTLWLSARAQGIGLGWVSILDPDEIRAALDLPPDWRLVGYFCIGYPAGEDETPELEREGWEQRRPAAILRR